MSLAKISTIKETTYPEKLNKIINSIYKKSAISIVISDDVLNRYINELLLENLPLILNKIEKIVTTLHIEHIPHSPKTIVLLINEVESIKEYYQKFKVFDPRLWEKVIFQIGSDTVFAAKTKEIIDSLTMNYLFNKLSYTSLMDEAKRLKIRIDIPIDYTLKNSARKNDINKLTNVLTKFEKKDIPQIIKGFSLSSTTNYFSDTFDHIVIPTNIPELDIYSFLNNLFSTSFKVETLIKEAKELNIETSYSNHSAYKYHKSLDKKIATVRLPIFTHLTKNVYFNRQRGKVFELDYSYIILNSDYFTLKELDHIFSFIYNNSDLLNIFLSDYQKYHLRLKINYNCLKDTKSIQRIIKTMNKIFRRLSYLKIDTLPFQIIEIGNNQDDLSEINQLNGYRFLTRIKKLHISNLSSDTIIRHHIFKITNIYMQKTFDYDLPKQLMSIKLIYREYKAIYKKFLKRIYINFIVSIFKNI